MGLLVAAVVLGGSPAVAQDPPEGSEPVLESTNAAWAVGPRSRSGEPDRASFTFEVFPGQMIQDTLAITNLTDAPIDFAIWSGDGYNTADGAYAIYGPDVEPVDVGRWVELPLRELTVDPRSRADIPIVIRVPENAEPGDHAGGIAALNTTPVQELETDNADIDVLRSIGSRVYVRVAGPLRRDLSISNIDVSAKGPLLPYVTGRGRTTVEYDVTNTGNLRVTPDVVSSIEGPFGLLERSSAPASLRELLPGSSVHVVQEIDAAPPLGPLTARVEATADDLEEVRTTTVWVIPWAYLLVVVAVGGIVWRRRRRRRRTPPDGGGATPRSAARRLVRV
jgi:hypothetical protein